MPCPLRKHPADHTVGIRQNARALGLKLGKCKLELRIVSRPAHSLVTGVQTVVSPSVIGRIAVA